MTIGAQRAVLLARMALKECGRLPAAALPKLALVGLARYQATSIIDARRRMACMDRARELEIGDLRHRREVGDRVVCHGDDDRCEHPHADNPIISQGSPEPHINLRFSLGLGRG